MKKIKEFGLIQPNFPKSKNIQSSNNSSQFQHSNKNY